MAPTPGSLIVAMAAFVALTACGRISCGFGDTISCDAVPGEFAVVDFQSGPDLGDRTDYLFIRLEDASSTADLVGWLEEAMAVRLETVQASSAGLHGWASLTTRSEEMVGGSVRAIDVGTIVAFCESLVPAIDAIACPFEPRDQLVVVAVVVDT